MHVLHRRAEQTAFLGQSVSVLDQKEIERWDTLRTRRILIEQDRDLRLKLLAKLNEQEQSDQSERQVPSIVYAIIYYLHVNKVQRARQNSLAVAEEEGFPETKHVISLRRWRQKLRDSMRMAIFNFGKNS